MPGSLLGFAWNGSGSVNSLNVDPSGGWNAINDSGLTGTAPAIGDTLVLIVGQGTQSGQVKLAEGTSATAGSAGSSTSSTPSSDRYFYRYSTGGSSRMHVFTRVVDGTEVYPLVITFYDSTGALKTGIQQALLFGARGLVGYRAAASQAASIATTVTTPPNSLGVLPLPATGTAAGDFVMRVMYAANGTAGGTRALQITDNTGAYVTGATTRVGKADNTGTVLRTVSARTIGTEYETYVDNTSTPARNFALIKGETSTVQGTNDLPGGSYIGLTLSFQAVSNSAPPTPTGAATIASNNGNNPAHIGDQLIVSTPASWTSGVTITGYQRQVQRAAVGSNSFSDYGAISSVQTTYAALPAYTTVSGDDGFQIRYREYAINANGTSTPGNDSNAVTVKGPPINSVAPAIQPTSGPYSTGQQISVTNGTWNGSPTFTYQWYRGTSQITGQNTNTYTLQQTDEGATIRCDVTATEAGQSTTVSSNTITPQVTSPLTDQSFLVYYSGGNNNQSPGASIGGARGATYPGGLSQLIGPIPGSVAQAGGTFYRGVYVRNTHPTATAASGKAFVEAQFASAAARGLHVSVGVPVETNNVNLPVLTSETVAPSSVTFTNATTPGSGQNFGNLGPGDFRGLWIKFVVDAGTQPITEDDFTVAIEATPA